MMTSGGVMMTSRGVVMTSHVLITIPLGILTSVFKHNKTTTKHSVVLRTRPTLTRKSVSNQDLSVENKMRNIPLHGGGVLLLIWIFEC